MVARLWDFIRHSDWVLTLSIFLLTLVSLSALYASGQSSEEAHLNFVHQAIFVGTGFVVYLIIGMLDYRRLRSLGPISYGLAIVLLVAVLFFGSTIRNTTGWFRIGSFGFQPIELVKLLWIIAMASFLVHRGQKMNVWKNIFWLLGLMLIPVLLTMLQPDLGSALVLIASTIGVMLMTKISWSRVLILFLLIVVIAVSSWFLVLQDYQKERIQVLFNPSLDPVGRGYHVTQSIIAIGSGGWFGRGLGFGSQSQLKFLPEQQTDFIFAVIGEELGFVGAGLVLVLFGIILYRCFRMAMTSPNSFGAFVVFGVMLLVFFHIVINVGMNIGLFPVAGIPLPFVSYGGSSLLVMMMAMGIVQSVSIREHR